MADNKIYRFAGGGGALVLNDTDYSADSQRIIGHQPGVARANFANKAAKQSSFIAEAVAQFIVDYAAQDVQDDQATSLVVTNFVAALQSLIGSSVHLSRRINKTQAASPYTVTASDLDGETIFTNSVASGEVILNLPAGADGYVGRALVTSAQYLRFKAAGVSTIRFLTAQSAAGGYVRSNVIGNFIEIKWSGTEWVVTSIGGPWNYDA